MFVVHPTATTPVRGMNAALPPPAWENHSARFSADWDTDRVVITARGELDASNAAQLADYFDLCIAHSTPLVLDLTCLLYTSHLILGSASQGRLRVLRQAGVEPTVVVSGVDEDAIIAALGADAAPGDVVRSLAEAKAKHVVTLLDPQIAADCVVIGCDSMLYIDGRLVGKPASIEAARLEWQSMAGRSGQLHSLIHISSSGPGEGAATVTEHP